MKRLVLEVKPLDSGLLLGGRSDSTRGADDATARDAQGRLILPATALRGALRIELERLLRGRGDHACSATGPRATDAGTAGAGVGAAGAESGTSGPVPNAAAEPVPAPESSSPPANEAGPAAAASGSPPPPDAPCACPVCRLFGTEGVGTGTLRLEDARLDGEERTVELRPRIAVSRKTGTVAHRLLGFAETGEVPSGEGACFRASAWLVPRSAEELDDGVLEQDRADLAAACRALTGLGGGKSRGLGWVECELTEAEVAAEAEASVASATVAPTVAVAGVREAPQVANAWRVRFVAEGPLHLGSGRPLGYFHPTLRHAPASTVRGALAFALLEQGLCAAEDADFQAMFGPNATVRFGTARRPSHVLSATRRQCRPKQHGFDDLVGEVLRREAADRGVALTTRPGHACPHPGCSATKITPAVDGTAFDDLRVRVHTRTAINRRTGTSMDAQLFSVELLEPWLRGSAESGSGTSEALVLEAELRDVSAETSELLAKLHGKHASLGGKRGQGMGRCRLELSPLAAPEVEAARTAVAALDRELREAWRGLVEAIEGLSGDLAPADHRPVAVVLTEPWLVSGEVTESLAKGALGRRADHAFLLVEPQGRFGAVEAQRWKAGEHVTVGEIPPQLVAAPGSTWLYWIEAAELERELPGWVAAGSRGEPGVDGRRYRVRGPEDPAEDLEER